MPNYISSPLPSQSAAGADANVLVGAVEPVPGAGYGVVAAVVVPPAGFATVTGVNTNNAQVSVRQLRAGSLVQTIGTLVLNSGTNLVAETPVAIPVTNPPSLRDGDLLDAVLHQNGTGVAVGAGLIVEVDVN